MWRPRIDDILANHSGGLFLQSDDERGKLALAIVLFGLILTHMDRKFRKRLTRSAAGLYQIVVHAAAQNDSSQR